LSLQMVAFANGEIMNVTFGYGLQKGDIG
jgi:hypothetical protein